MGARLQISAAALVLVLTGGWAVQACGSFGEGDDAPPGTEAGSGDGGDAAVANACTPLSLSPPDAGAPDAYCEGPQPVELPSDDGHCGVCNHSCLGEGCVGGSCRITELAVDAFIANTPMQVGRVADGTLYTAHGPTIFRTATSGPGAGALTPFVMGAALSIKSFNAPFFAKGRGWASSDLGIVSFALDGSIPTLELGEKVDRIASDGSNIFWATADTGRVSKLGTPTPVLDDPSIKSIDAMASDDDGLFVMVTRKVTGRTDLLALKPDGGTARVLSDLATTYVMALDGPHIYWADVDGEVSRVEKTSTTKEAVMHVPKGVPPATPRFVPKGLAVDATSVYVATTDDKDGGTVQAAFYTTQKCGGPARLMTSDVIFSYGLAVDGDHLYWARASSAARIAK